MKIGIIGGSDGFGQVLAAELAKRYLPEEVEVVVVGAGPEAITAEDMRRFDVLFREREYVEAKAIPLPVPEVIAWPDTIKPHRHRYNRKPKWQQSYGGSKYF